MADYKDSLTWQDRLVDAMRSRGTALFLAGLLLGWLVFSDHPGDQVLLVTVHNDSGVLIESVRFDFSHALSQSSLFEGQLRPGERRRVALNHPPGAGFNPHISPPFAARASRRRCDGARGPEDGAGVADTTSNRLERARPVTARGSAAAVEGW